MVVLLSLVCSNTFIFPFPFFFISELSLKWIIIRLSTVSIFDINTQTNKIHTFSGIHCPNCFAAFFCITNKSGDYDLQTVSNFYTRKEERCWLIKDYLNEIGDTYIDLSFCDGTSASIDAPFKSGHVAALQSWFDKYLTMLRAVKFERAQLFPEVASKTEAPPP